MSSTKMEATIVSNQSRDTDDNEEDDNQEFDEEDEEEEDYRGFLPEDEASSEDMRESQEETPSEVIEVGLYRPVLTSRRAVAEVLSYNLNYVQSLHEMSLKAIAASFYTDPIDLNLLTREEQDYIIEHFSGDLPLTIAAGRIESEKYWRTRCESYLGTEAFKKADMAEYEGSYRRLFFETYLQDRICNFIPLIHEYERLELDVSSGGRFVRKLSLDQLMIPVARRVTGEEVLFDEQGKKASRDYNHVDLEPLGQYFTQLEELSVRYGVNNCGLNFDWAMFHCTETDVLNLCGMMRSVKTLRSLRVSHSRLSDLHVSTLATNLGNWCTLGSLCLAHNGISDDGARMLGRFLKNDSSLLLLDLTDNKIHSEGGMALAHGLKFNRTLAKLKLRLNLLGYEAIQMFILVLRFNPVLETLNLSANIIDDRCCADLGRAMRDFAYLSSLNLSANPRVTNEGVYSLLKGLQQNETLQKLKLEGLPGEQDFFLCIAEKLNSNTVRRSMQDKSSNSEFS